MNLSLYRFNRYSLDEYIKEKHLSQVQYIPILIDTPLLLLYSLIMTRLNETLWLLSNNQDQLEGIISDLKTIESFFKETHFSYAYECNHNHCLISVLGRTHASSATVQTFFETTQWQSQAILYAFNDYYFELKNATIACIEENKWIVLGELAPNWEEPTTHLTFKILRNQILSKTNATKTYHYWTEQQKFIPVLFDFEKDVVHLQRISTEKSQSSSVDTPVDGVVFSVLSAEHSMSDYCQFIHLMDRHIDVPIFLEVKDTRDLSKLLNSTFDGLILHMHQELNSENAEILGKLECPIMFVHAMDLSRDVSQFYEGAFKQIKAEDKIGLLIHDLLDFARIGFEGGVQKEHLWLAPGWVYKTPKERTLIFENISKLKQLGFPFGINYTPAVKENVHLTIFD